MMMLAQRACQKRTLEARRARQPRKDAWYEETHGSMDQLPMPFPEPAPRERSGQPIAPLARRPSERRPRWLDR